LLEAFCYRLLAFFKRDIKRDGRGLETTSIID